MADLGNRANVNSAIDLLLDDLQPDEAIQPSDHNVLLKDILDTLANGLSTVLRTGNTTDGQNLTITSSSIFQFSNGSNGRLQSDTLTAFRNWTLPDTTGTIALLSDIPSSDNIYTANGTLTGDRTVDLDGNDLTFNLGSGTASGVIVDGSLTTGATAIVNFKGVGVNNALAMGDTGFLANQGITNQSVLSLLNTSNQGIKIKGSYSGIYSSFTEFKKSTTTSNTRLGHFLNNTRAETQYYNSSDDLVHHITLGSPFACSFFRNGVVGGFVVGSNAVIGTEDISLQGSTLIKGNGTSTGSALAIYDNDTTPNKLWDFLDNGKLNASNLPTISTGTVVGDVWSQNGTVKIGNPSANITTVASVGGLTVNADTTEVAKVLALATNITINAPTGTPNDNQSLWFRILDNGTSRTITLNAVFEDYTGNFPTSTTAGKYLIFAGKWNADEGKWNILAWKVQP